MNNNIQDKVKSLEIDILKELDRICISNNITYFLAYGTLLGAVRHHGFIPWDDDIDVYMPKLDFDKFMVVSQRELDKKKYFLQTFSMDNKYPLPMKKIRLVGTRFVEKEYDKMQSEGIWIDIFPMGTTKSNKSIFQLFKFKVVNVLSLVKCIKLGWSDLQGTSMFTRIISLILKPFTPNFVNGLMERVGFSNSYGDYFVEYFGCYGFAKQTFLKSDFFPPKKLMFEGDLYQVPNNYNSILKTIYGLNYMELPPVEKRKTHKPILVDLGCYDED
jgi:lipopolysaccharide cholinephosphotransferase